MRQARRLGASCARHRGGALLAAVVVGLNLFGISASAAFVPGLVTDIHPGSGSSDPRDFANVDGKTFFPADDGTSGRELWRTDGTDAGTRLVKDIDPGSGSAAPRLLTNVNGTLMFAADDGIHGLELWRSDGTDAGTTLVKDINRGGGNSLSLSAFVTV